MPPGSGEGDHKMGEFMFRPVRGMRKQGGEWGEIRRFAVVYGDRGRETRGRGTADMPEGDSARISANGAGAAIGPLVGMVFVWSYFRYQSFFGTLYPLDSVVVCGGASLHAYPMLLILLLGGTLLVMAFPHRIERLLEHRRPVVFAATVAGSVGALLALLSLRGLLGSWVYGLSVVLVVVGFLAGYLAWAAYCARAMDRRLAVLLAASFLASIVVYMVLGHIPVVRMVLRVVTPLGAGLAWLLTPCPPEHGAALPARPHPDRGVYSYTVLFIVFLLAGAVVRGIVDIGDAFINSSLRFGISVVVALAVLVFCWLFERGAFDRGAMLHTDFEESYATERMMLICWMVLALMFFAGLFMGLAAGSWSPGGHVVVVARSTLDFLLWLLLCNLVRYHHLPPIRLFALCGILIEVASWFLSYIVVPHLLSTVGADASESLVLVLLFLLVAAITTIFGGMVLRRRPEMSSAPLEHPAAQADAPSSAPTAFVVPRVERERYGLTAREVEVVQLFSQGHSLRKVADQMFISVSTAQSHVKSAYRKLDIHSKDELIDLMSGWNR